MAAGISSRCSHIRWGYFGVQFNQSIPLKPQHTGKGISGTLRGKNR
jgi:hypothetical protein